MRRLPLYFTALVIALFTFTMLWAETRLHRGFLSDDAYISLRYARNLVEGHGLVYNPGERVEGYTNFALTILMTLPYWLGLDPVIFVKALGWVAGASLIVTTGTLTRRLAGPFAAAAVMIVMALDQRYAWFCGCGLETIMVGALYVPALLLLDRGKVGSSALLFTCAVLTRMETILLFGAAAAFLVACSGFQPTRARATAQRLRRSVRFVTVFAVTYGIYYGWRFVYYGWAFPNTYYVKVGSVQSAWRRGLDYLEVSLVAMGLRSAIIASAGALLIIALASGLRLIVRRRVPRLRRRGLGLLVAGSCALYAAYVMMVGGDHFQERFIYHFYPLLLVTVAWTWRTLLDVTTIASRVPRTLGYAVSGLLVAAFLVPLASAPARFGPEAGLAGFSTVGVYLREAAKPDATVATCAAGLIAFESNLRTIDILGLTDEHIAHMQVDIGHGVAGHEKRDPAYVLQRNPDVITTWIDADGHVGRGFRGFYQFWRDYEITQAVRMDTRFDTSFERVLPVPKETTLETLSLNGLGKGAPVGFYQWGLWTRRTGPVPPRSFGWQDMWSRVPNATGHEGSLASVSAGHPEGFVMIEWPMEYPAGKYVVSFSLETKGSETLAPDTELCAFDMWDGRRALNRHALLAADWLNRNRRLTATFEVLAENSTRGLETRFYCSGAADFTVRSGWLDACSGDCAIVAAPM